MSQNYRNGNHQQIFFQKFHSLSNDDDGDHNAIWFIMTCAVYQYFQGNKFKFRAVRNMLWQNFWVQSFPITNNFQTSNLNHATGNLNFENRSNESFTESNRIWKIAKIEKNWKNAKNAAIEADLENLGSTAYYNILHKHIGFGTKFIIKTFY